MPAYLYWGEEDFNIEIAVQELRNKVLDPNFAALNHKKLDEPNVRHLTETLQTLPMMFGNLLVEVKATSLFLRKTKKSANSDNETADAESPVSENTAIDTQKLMNVIENLNERVHLLLICPVPRESGKKIDGVLKLTKLLQKVAKVEEFPAYKYYEEAKAAEWTVKQAESKDIKISAKCASIIVSNIGLDLRNIDLEIEKLKTLIHPKTQIAESDLKDLVATHENIFDLLNYWIKNHKSEALTELYKLFERNNPLKILATMQTMTRRWLKILILSKKYNSFEVAKKVGQQKYALEKDMERLKHVSVERLIMLREKAVETEFKIKSGALLPEEALEILIME